jgi:tetratricopeptide (TPR) repeat protein
MKPISFTLLTLTLILSLFATGCSERREASPLYVLEELDAASAVSDPEQRIERLGIFVKNHPRHQYRKLAYGKTFETMMEDLDDPGRADRYFEEVMARETDPKIRGSFFYTKFSMLWKADKERAVELARELAEGPESSYRLFLYMAYYLIWDEDCAKNADLAERVLERAINASADGYERNQAVAVMGNLKRKLGQDDEALEILVPVAGTYAADEIIAEILWGKGRRDEALEAYIRLAAVVPGMREGVSLDSLYALVHQDTSQLDAKIWEARIVEGEALVPQRFVDIEGKSFDLADFKGTKLVVNIWQPG